MSRAFERLARPLRRGLARFRSWTGTRPTLFFAVYGLRAKTRRLRVRPESRIVIEGFPRSANSFTVVAFARAQGRSARELRIAHHLHVPAQIRRGIRLGIPVVLLVRDPVDATVSLHLREPWRSLEETLVDYCRFHRAVLECDPAGYVVAPFDLVTQHLDEVIGTVNERFDTDFKKFDPTEENTAVVFSELEALEHHGGRVRERAVARPSEERNRWKKRARERLLEEADPALIDMARELFRIFQEKSIR